MEAKDEKPNYSNRRKTFHFSKKNDDLLQYLNQKDTKEQSAFIMRLIREEMENEGKPDPLQSLQEQLNQALAEIKRLKENLANPIPVSVESINANNGGVDEEIINRLFVMLADIKHSNEQNFNDMKNLANPIPVSVESINANNGGVDEEIINRLFVMLADIKHSNEQNFNDMKNLLIKGVNIDVVATEEASEDSEELSDEEFDELFDDDLDF